MERYSTTIILCSAIMLMSFGIHISNFILVGIGGFLVGVYNAMTHKTRLKEK